MEVESSSMGEEIDGLSTSQNSENMLLSSPARPPRNLNEAIQMQQEQQQHQQQQQRMVAAVSNKESQRQQRPRTFNETLKLQQQHNIKKHDTSTSSSQTSVKSSHTGVIQRRDRISSTKETASPSKQHTSLKQMFRLSTPESVLTSKRDSPNVSPSPKAMKPTIGSNSRSSESPAMERTKFLSNAKAFLSPHTSRKRSEDLEKQSGAKLLTVPHPFLRANSSRDINSYSKDTSSSSLSSGYFGGSSRSGTTSPVTPETPPPPHPQTVAHHHHPNYQQYAHQQYSISSSNNNKWYSPQDTPPPTPPSRGGQVFDFSKKIVDSSFQRTSSLSRPLGITRSASSPSPILPSMSLPNWQAERWKHWEEEAKQRSDQTQEQETLV